MRRWLHCLLIGVLTCSLSVDTAKACWYLRHTHAACGCWRPVCPPVAAWPTCHEVVVSDTAWCGEPVCGEVVIVEVWPGDVCCTEGVSAVAAPVVGQHVQPRGTAVAGAAVAEPAGAAGAGNAASEPVVAAEPTRPAPAAPAPKEPVAAQQPTPEAGVATVAPSVPQLKPAADAAPAVETVVALEPAPTEPTPVEPAPVEPDVVKPAAEQPPAVESKPAEPTPVEPVAEPEPAPVEPVAEPPAPPAEPNIFEEVEAEADAAILGAAAPEEDAGSDEPSAEPAGGDVFGAAEADPAAEAPLAEPAAEPATEAADDATTPAAESPADAPASGEPAEDQADPFSDASREPLRRWVDVTGSYATVGMLVDVRSDAVEIRKSNGRTVVVPLERLSEHDRAYAADAGARLAAERAPSSRETAGL